MTKYNQNGKGYSVSVQKPDLGGLPQITGYPDHTPPIFYDKLMGNNTNKVPSLQKAGAKMYSKIYNPESGRMVNAQGKLGRQIIQSYINTLQMGGADISALNGPPSVFDPNMINRSFGCKQPQWQPNCV